MNRFTRINFSLSYFVKFLNTDVTNRGLFFLIGHFKKMFKNAFKRCSKTLLSAGFIMILGEINFFVNFTYRHNKARIKQQFSAMHLEDAYH